MALREDHDILEYDPHCSATGAHERGMFLFYVTAGSGASVADSPTVGLNQTSGGYPAGCLMADVVDNDESVYYRNPYKRIQTVGEKVPIARKGFVVTDKVTGTPAKGQAAYLLTTGNVSPTKNVDGGVAVSPPVGTFGSIKDEHGFVRVDINLPFARV